MFDLDKWQEIFNSISKNKTRTVLTGFSVATGIFMLIFLLGAGRALKNGVQKTFQQDAQNSIVIYGGRTKIAHKGTPIGKRIRLNNRDYEVLKRTIPNLDAIAATSYIPGAEYISYKNKFGNFSVTPIHSEYYKAKNIEMIEGRFLNKNDLDENKKVVVIEKSVLSSLFGEADAIGEFVNINDILFKVIGVYQQADFNGNSKELFIPITLAQKVFNNDDKLGNLFLTFDNISVEKSKEIERIITQKIATNHDFSKSDINALWINNNIENSKNFTMIFSAISTIIWIVGIFTLLLGVIGVFNIMMIVVKERTKEIGIRKALGATPSQVIGLILTESVFITAVSGYLGLFVGVWILSLFDKYTLLEKLYPPAAMYFKEPNVDISTAIAATFVLVFAGVIAGFIPARKAAAIKPIDALRDE